MVSKYRMDEEGRACSKCTRYLPWAEFSIAPDKKTGRGSWCKQCTRAKLYGLSPEEQEAMLAAQGGRCRGCRRLFTEDLPYAVDHCHDTLRVRALLCDRCNLCLGHLPTKERLSAAQAYVRRHNARLGVTPPPLPD